MGAPDDHQGGVHARRAGESGADDSRGGRRQRVRSRGPQPRDAFVERYLRRGIDSGVEMKSLSGASGGEGGYAVPREIDGSIAATLKDLSPIRGIATVVQTGTSGYRKLVATGSMGAGWVGETAARPET